MVCIIPLIGSVKGSVTSINTFWLIPWGIHYIFQGCGTIGGGNYFYIHFETFVHFTPYNIWVCFVLVFCYIPSLCMSDSTTLSSLYMSLYWYVCEYFTCFCIDMFLYLIQFNKFLYLILRHLYIYLLCMGYSTTVLVLNMFLFSYVCPYYINVYRNKLEYFTKYTTWLYSILGNIGMCIYWFILPLFPSLLTWIHDSLLIPRCYKFTIFFHMHWNTYLCY